MHDLGSTAKAKSAADSVKGLQTFLTNGDGPKVKLFYSDGSNVEQEGPFKFPTPYKTKWGGKVDKCNPRIVDLPFGARCEFLPDNMKLKKRCKKFGKR